MQVSAVNLQKSVYSYSGISQHLWNLPLWRLEGFITHLLYTKAVCKALNSKFSKLCARQCHKRLFCRCDSCRKWCPCTIESSAIVIAYMLEVSNSGVIINEVHLQAHEVRQKWTTNSIDILFQEQYLRIAKVLPKACVAFLSEATKRENTCLFMMTSRDQVSEDCSPWSCNFNVYTATPVVVIQLCHQVTSVDAVVHIRPRSSHHVIQSVTRVSVRSKWACWHWLFDFCNRLCHREGVLIGPLYVSVVPAVVYAGCERVPKLMWTCNVCFHVDESSIVIVQAEGKALSLCPMVASLGTFFTSWVEPFVRWKMRMPLS